jgi:hypothetical protein
MPAGNLIPLCEDSPCYAVCKAAVAAAQAPVFCSARGALIEKDP